MVAKPSELQGLFGDNGRATNLNDYNAATNTPPAFPRLEALEFQAQEPTRQTDQLPHPD